MGLGEPVEVLEEVIELVLVLVTKILRVAA